MNGIPSSTGSSMDALFSNLITNVVISKLGLDMANFGMVFACVLEMFRFLKSDYSISEYLTGFNVFYIVLIFGCYQIYKSWDKIKRWLFNKKDDEYIKIRIYEVENIMELKKYINYFPQFYETSYDVDIGNPQFVSEFMLCKEGDKLNDEFLNHIDMVIPSVDSKIKFKDDNLKMEGFICWKNYEYTPTYVDEKESKKKKTVLSFRYPEIHIKKGGIKNSEEFMKTIKNEIDKLEKNKIVTYKYIKHINGLPHIAPFYKGKILPFEQKEKIYIDSFFHKEKDRLWNIIKNIHLHPESFHKFGQAARISLLLHGPHGTGKSSFAYRVAMCLSRHIVSIDIKDVRDKRLLYQMFQKPNLEGRNEDASKCVFILDEFDMSVRYLYYRDKILNGSIQNLVTKLETCDDFDDFFESDDDEDLKNNKKSNKKSSSPCNFDLDEENFGLKDLLEIFQGAIPIEGMILFATTNDYDEIKSLCPALFRPGRLTPVYFGYIEKSTLQDISVYYFGKKLKIYIPEVIKVPTSQIIELALEASFIEDNGFEYFEHNLDKIL